MNRTVLMFVFYTCLSIGFAICEATVPQTKSIVHIVLLGGQSNMAGSGSYNLLSDADKTRIKAISPRILLSRNSNPAEPLSFEISQYQLDKRGFSECFGPEMFIAVTLAEKNPTQEYLFIKVTQGGTALYGAWNPEWSAEKAAAVENKDFKKKLKLYEKHITAIQFHITQLQGQGRSYKIVGMAWMQGENDATKEVSSRSYEENLKKLIAAYRSEFTIPEMPFVAGQINSHYGRFAEGPDIVRQAFINVAESDPNVAVIQTKPDAPWTNYPKHDDQVHYNHEGLKRLGTAMGNALIELSQ